MIGLVRINKVGKHNNSNLSILFWIRYLVVLWQVVAASWQLDMLSRQVDKLSRQLVTKQLNAGSEQYNVGPSSHACPLCWFSPVLSWRMVVRPYKHDFSDSCNLPRQVDTESGNLTAKISNFSELKTSETTPISKKASGRSLGKTIF